MTFLAWATMAFPASFGALLYYLEDAPTFFPAPWIVYGFVGLCFWCIGGMAGEVLGIEDERDDGVTRFMKRRVKRIRRR